MRFTRSVLFALTTLAFTACSHAQSDQAIYTDALQNGWTSYGWATLNYANGSPVHGTSGASIRVNAGAYEAIYLHHAAMDTADYASLTFWMHGGTAGGQSLICQALLNGTPQPPVDLPAPAANAWQQVTLPLASLGAAGRTDFDGIWIKNKTGSTLPAFYLDDLALVARAPPASIVLSVDAASVIRTVDPRLFGVNTAIWDSQLGTAATRTVLPQIGMRALRYPGGSASDDYDWQTNRSVTSGTHWASSFAVFAPLATALGAQPYLTVNYGSGTPEQAAAWVAYANGDPASPLALGTDAKGRNWKTAGYWAALRAATPLATDDGYNFLRLGRAAPFAFKYWEIGNENYGSWERDEHGTTFSGAPHDPLTYAQFFATFRSQMLAVDPTLKIGAVVTGDADGYNTGSHIVTNPRDGSTHTGWTPVVLANLKTLGALPAFLTYHDYAQNPGQESDVGLLAAAATIPARRSAALRQMLTDYIGTPASTGIELALTELNSVSGDPGKQTTSLVNGLFLAESLGALAATEFNACLWWDLRNGSTNFNNSNSLYGARLHGDFGLLAAGDRSDTPVNRAYPSFRACELLTKWTAGGDRIVTSGTNYGLLTVHASRRADGRLCLLVINKAPATDFTAQLQLSHFIPGASTATVYQFTKSNDTNNTGLTISTLSGVSASFSATFPAYSMTVLDFAKPLTGFAAWQQSRFTATELADPVLSSETADPDHDGIPNLTEYALALDPHAASRAGLPTLARTTLGGSSFPTLSFPQVKAATDVSYLVEFSRDLVHWEIGSAATMETSRADQGATELVTVRSLTPLDDAAPRQFLRLRVVR